MCERSAAGAVLLPSVGAYQGGRPASTVGPPPRRPSGTVEAPKKKRAKKAS